jgi:S-adenosylmethionine synthetase
MFGFACDETPQLMPLPIKMAHSLSERLAQVRHLGLVDFLRPDGKTQVTIGYDNGKATSVSTVVISTQHKPKVLRSELVQAVRELVIAPVLDEFGFDSKDSELLINPTGNFVIGGPQGDAGLTGRKIIIDTYGGYSRHGGGAFSGKDPSKVDRSAAYAMRWVAKNVVAAGLASKVEVQVAYAIGVAKPVGLYVETFGTHTVDPDKIEKAILEVFDLRPRAIIDQLDLLRPIYSATSTYGHFGRELPEFTWERLDRVAQLQSAAGI